MSVKSQLVRYVGRDVANTERHDGPLDRVAAFVVFPHPENPERYVAVHGGATPDAISWGSHLAMHLLPDYIVYARGEMIDWGFWNNEWKAQGQRA